MWKRRVHLDLHIRGLSAYKCESTGIFLPILSEEERTLTLHFVSTRRVRALCTAAGRPTLLETVREAGE